MRQIAEIIDRTRSLAGPPALLSNARERTRALLTQFAQAGGRRAVAVADVNMQGGIEGVGLDELKPAASALKIALVAATLQAGRTSAIDLDERVGVDEMLETKWPSVLDALDDNVSLRLRDLCSFSITTSDNGASDILMRRLGLFQVAAWLQSVGCSSATQLASGFADAAIEGTGRLNTITARDATIILRAVLHEPVYDALVLAMANNVRNQRIPRFLDDDICVAHKTGSLNGVVNDIGIIIARDTAFLLTVLCEDQSDTYATEGQIARLAQQLVALA